MINTVVAMLVPTRWLRRLAIVSDPAAAAHDPLVTQVPDTWVPPWWVGRERLGAGHPNALPLPKGHKASFAVTDEVIAPDRPSVIEQIIRAQRR